MLGGSREVLEVLPSGVGSVSASGFLHRIRCRTISKWHDSGMAQRMLGVKRERTYSHQRTTAEVH
jgi:hypothetical protein